MSTPQLDLNTLFDMYQCMWRIRHFESAAGNLYKQGLIKGGIHASIGQEAVSVGVAFAMQKGDWFASTHRGHAHHIAAGAGLNRMMAEIRAKETGYCKGRGGSMHIAAFDVGSLGAYPLVAGGIPIAVGAALKEKMTGTDRIAVTYFGDGALGQGTTFECLNLATVWKLPVIFVCENNQLAVATTYEDASAIHDFEQLGDTFGMPGSSVDGQSVLDVYAAAQKAITRARAGEGPTFLECRTHRFEGHYFGEPQLYRTREEVEKLRHTRDPIVLFEQHLLAEKLSDPEKLKQLAETASDEVQGALRFAEESPDPDPHTFEEYVYA
jgi:TPP-dependent pyruvate/acetoin dehydrogenase alpha subunit